MHQLLARIYCITLQTDYSTSIECTTIFSIHNIRTYCVNSKTDQWLHSKRLEEAEKPTENLHSIDVVQ